ESREMFEILPKTNHVYLTSAFNPKLDSYFCEANTVHTWKQDSKYKTYGNNIYTKDGKELVFVPAPTKKLKIRNGCKIVTLDSFSYDWGSVGMCFYFCNNLKYIEFPSSVKKITTEYHDNNYYSYGPFKKCKLKFHSKKLTGNVLAALYDTSRKEFLTKKYGVKTIKGMKISYDHVLLKCPMNKKSITIPKGVKSISHIAFRVGKHRNPKLKKITLPSSMKTITDKAFYRVPVETVKIPNSVTKIGDSAFYCSNIKSIKLPKNLKSIGVNAFFGTRLKSVTIPKSVKELGGSCFGHATKLQKVVIKGNMKSLPRWMCHGSAVKEIVLPNSIETIGNDAFYNCKDLEKIVLPTNLKSIGAESFFYCTNLSNVKFNNKICTIGDYAFAGTKIKNIVIPKNIKEIGSGVFLDCPLERVDLQEGVEVFDAKVLEVEYYPVDKEYTHNMVEVSIPKTLKKIQNVPSHKKEKVGPFIYSTNQNFDAPNVIEMTENNPFVDVSSLRDHSELYCKFIRESTDYYNSKYTVTVPCHFIFK
ncbi:MAG: leucine-rich repeat domain-containing protein, partial [Eubacterium sp.]|nr:leucine-rich repeat domain-containing protein [Eubacterium sp.]